MINKNVYEKAASDLINGKCLVSDEFEIYKKWGLTWILLSIAQPFYRLFGKDAFSHFRVDNVAAKILTISQNSGSLDTVTKASLFKIVTSLREKTNKDLGLNNIRANLFPPVLGPNPQKPITDGYGEFVVSSINGKDVDQKTFEAANSIFMKYRDVENRVNLINHEVRLIDPNLQVTFIPRTLYELFFMKNIIESDTEEANINKEAESAAENEHIYINKHVLGSTGYFEINQKKLENSGLNEEISGLSFKVNNLIVSDLKYSGNIVSHLTFSEISNEVDHKINYFLEKFNGGNNIPVSYKIKQALGKGGFLLKNPRELNIIRSMIALECSERSIHANVICRGAQDFLYDMTLSRNEKGEIEVLKDSTSFGTSLFAGLVYDTNAMTFEHMRLQKDSYAIVVSKSDAQSPFYIPRDHAISQFFGKGEAFHARSKAAKGDENRTGTGAGGGLNEGLARQQMKSEFSREEIFERFDDYKRSAVFFAPKPKFCV